MQLIMRFDKVNWNIENAGAYCQAGKQAMQDKLQALRGMYAVLMRLSAHM